MPSDEYGQDSALHTTFMETLLCRKFKMADESKWQMF
jgi:hypothetical protein